MMQRKIRTLAFLVLLGAAPAAQANERFAHAPHFDDKHTWPNVTGVEGFVKQTWNKARVLIWANPGKSGPAAADRARLKGGGRDPGLDPDEAANWLEDSKPAQAPPDKETDIVLPPADVEYHVCLGTGVRHATVQNNGFLTLPELTGNLWLQNGGRFYPVGRSARLKGDKHTFLRNDNVPPDPKG
jgi:hypothetical protein